MFRLLKTVGFVLLIAVFSLAGTILAQDDHGDEGDEHGHEEAPHWSYEGETGPEHWGELSEDYTLCVDGSAQSPIDIGEVIDADLTNITFNYGETALNIRNNGHTVQVDVDAGSSITYQGITYNLLQFHFHHPSEHTVNGQAADMEIHFVHQNPHSGNLAVVGVLLVGGADENAAYEAVLANAPTERTDGAIMVDGVTLDLNSLLPEQTTYFTYNGSLTTPPCSEIVRWLLLDNVVELTDEQVEAFASIFENNARPVQSSEGRDVFHDTSE